jgi:hypothetical protein
MQGMPVGSHLTSLPDFSTARTFSVISICSFSSLLGARPRILLMLSRCVCRCVHAGCSAWPTSTGSAMHDLHACPHRQSTPCSDSTTCCVAAAHLHSLNVLEPQLMVDDLQILYGVNAVLRMHHIRILQHVISLVSSRFHNPQADFH